MRNIFTRNFGFIMIYILLALVYLLSLQYLPVTVTIEMKVSERDMGQLFYNTGPGYRETESIWFPVDDPGKFNTYPLQVPGVKVDSLRIDPLTRDGTFAVRSITIETPGHHLKLEAEELRDNIVPLNQVKLDYRDGSVYGISTGEDPQFGLDGAWVPNHLPLYVSVAVLLALLIFLLGARKLLPGSQYELAFALLLVVLALPVVMPRFFSVALALVAILLFGYLCFKYNKAQPALSPDNGSGAPGWTLLRNEKFVGGACLVMLLLLAFFLRYINLTILDPYTDEYSHLLAAKEYLDTGVLRYTRASLVTHLVALFYQLGNASTFYEYLFWGRLPGVIFGALTVIPLYFLTRKISFPVALISCFLWATSPWAIGVARTIREYAFYPFFILLAVLALIKALELLFEYRLRSLPKAILYLLPAIALIAYAFRFDTASTLKIIPVIFAGIGAYYLLVNLDRLRDLSGNKRFALPVTILLVVLVAAAMLLYAQRSGHVSITDLKFTDYWMRILVLPGYPGSPMQWWGDYSFLPIVLFIGAVSLIFAVNNKTRYTHYFLHLVVFSFVLVFFVFFFDRYFRPRYIFYALPFFVPLVAVSVYGLIDYAKKLKPLALKVFGSLAVALFLFQVFNYQNILYPVVSDEHGYVRTTDEHHDSLKSTIALLEDKLVSEDVIVTSIFSGMLILALDLEPDRIFIYDYKKANRFERVERAVEENPRGFMILDWRRNGHFAEGYPHEGQFLIGETTVEVIQNKDGMQIYRWQR